MTQNSSRNCPELPRQHPSTLWLITILGNVLLIFLRIKEPWNEPESPRNINIDSFFWVILGFFLRRNVITFWLYKNRANVTGQPRTFWVILGHSRGHSGDFYLQCMRALLFCVFVIMVIIFSQLKGIIRRAIKFMTCMLIVVSWNGKCALL
jgi:lipid-A-disaccharide synthase-like uncharacterized protein